MAPTTKATESPAPVDADADVAMGEAPQEYVEPERDVNDPANRTWLDENAIKIVRLTRIKCESESPLNFILARRILGNGRLFPI